MALVSAQITRENWMKMRPSDVTADHVTAARDRRLLPTLRAFHISFSYYYRRYY